MRNTPVQVRGLGNAGFLNLLGNNNGLSASPTNPNFGSHLSGYSQQVAQTITITNTSNTTITLNPLSTVPNWTLAANTNWTTAMTPSETRTFTIRPNNGLMSGTYNPEIFITGSNLTSAIIQPTFTVIQAPGAPTITVNPSDRTVTEGGNTAFNVEASGNPILAFQWQVSTNNGSTWTNLFGETRPRYDLANIQFIANGNRYRCVVTNAQGATTSASATLIVSRPPPINITGISQLVRGHNEWSRRGLQGVTGRIVEINWSTLSNADGAVSIYCSVNGRIRSAGINTRSLSFSTEPGRTYEVRFFINNNAFFETFNYRIASQV
jgi:hypothetical protein